MLKYDKLYLDYIGLVLESELHWKPFASTFEVFLFVSGLPFIWYPKIIAGELFVRSEISQHKTFTISFVNSDENLKKQKTLQLCSVQP